MNQRLSLAKTMEGGFGMVEVAASLVLLAVSTLGFVSLVTSVRTLQEDTRSRMQAMNAAREVVEVVRETQFEQIFSSFNNDPSDDPGGAGSAMGSSFDLGNLVGRLGNLTGLGGGEGETLLGGLLGGLTGGGETGGEGSKQTTGSTQPGEHGTSATAARANYTANILFPIDPTTGALREVIGSAEWPSLDLNGDGKLDQGDRSSDYVMLPARVTVQWESSRGVQSYSVSTIITRRS